MTLTKERAIAYVFHGLRGDPAVETPYSDILNHAGHHLINMHDWTWTLRGQERLDVRGNIAFTDATWDETGDVAGQAFTITKTSGFTNYVFVEGDRVEITGGTNAETKFFIVADRINANEITTAKSISATDETTDIAGTLRLDRIALPDNFRKFAAQEATNSLTNSLQLVTPQQLLSLRTNEIEVTPRNFFGAVVYSRGQPDGKPTAVLEIWPEPTSDDDEAISIFYYEDWVELDDDQDEIMVVPWMELPYLRIARAIAKGWEHDDTAQRLIDVALDPAVLEAMHRDGSIQDDFGHIRGGAVQATKTAHTAALLRTTIGAPT